MPGNGTACRAALLPGRNCHRFVQNKELPTVPPGEEQQLSTPAPVENTNLMARPITHSSNARIWR